MAPVNTTLDRPDTVDSKSQVPAWALVLLWADSEFHRAGELAFLPGFEPIIVGRQDNGTEMYARFGKQRPASPTGRADPNPSSRATASPAGSSAFSPPPSASRWRTSAAARCS
jgi:hypothetical protein